MGQTIEPLPLEEDQPEAPPKCNLKVMISPRYKLKNQMPSKKTQELKSFENLNLRVDEKVAQQENSKEKHIIMDFD